MMKQKTIVFVVEILALVFLPLWFLHTYPQFLQWRVPLMGLGVIYIWQMAKANFWSKKNLFLDAGVINWKSWFVWINILLAILVYLLMRLVPDFIKISEFITEAKGYSPFFAILIYVLFSAPLQEIIFRGYLIKRIKSITDNAYVVIILSAIIFGLVHAPFSNQALGAGTFLIGLWWAYYVYYYRSIYPVIFSHALLGGIIMGMTLFNK